MLNKSLQSIAVIKNKTIFIIKSPYVTTGLFFLKTSSALAFSSLFFLFISLVSFTNNSIPSLLSCSIFNILGKFLVIKSYFSIHFLLNLQIY